MDLPDWLIPSPVAKGGTGFTHEAPGGGSHEWFTPPWVFEAIGLRFDLDPCYPEHAVIPWIPANRVYTKQDDGLIQSWEGLVWCNPPYGRETPKWMKRMNDHRNGVALVFSRTEVDWFQESCCQADGILFLNRRVSFVDENGKKPISKKTGKIASSPGCGSILVAWGPVAMSAIVRMEEQGYGRVWGQPFKKAEVNNND